MTEWDGIFAASGSPVVTQKFIFAYQTSTISVPATTTVSTSAIVEDGAEQPAANIRSDQAHPGMTRAPRRGQHGEIATAPTNSGSEQRPRHRGHVRIQCSPRQQRRSCAAHPVENMVIITKNGLDVATGAFQSAMNSHASLRPVTINFLGGSSKLFTVTLNDTGITSDSQSVANGQATESVKLATTLTGATLLDVAGGVTASF